MRHPHHTITERDVRVVCAVCTHRYLTGTQIQRLYFPSETTRNRRLRRLIEAGLITPFTVYGVPERIFALTRDGARLAAAERGATLEDLRWRPHRKKPSDYYFMRHFLALNDFRIALAQAVEAAPDLALCGFIPEYYGARRRGRPPERVITDEASALTGREETITHTPDAVFALRKEEREALFFLEVDRGTEPLSNPERGVLKMLRFYMGYQAAGGFRGYAGRFGAAPLKLFRTLVVTSSNERLQNMAEAARSFFPERLHRALTLVWGAATGDVDARTVLKPVWRPFVGARDTRYAIG